MKTMTRKERTLNELRQVKDSVYDMPRTETMTPVEQNLLDELNYKASLILKLEDMFKEKSVPVDSKSLYTFTIKQLESVWTLWTSDSE
jgi:hypothetical protein